MYNFQQNISLPQQGQQIKQVCTSFQQNLNVQKQYFSKRVQNETTYRVKGIQQIEQYSIYRSAQKSRLLKTVQATQLEAQSQSTKQNFHINIAGAGIAGLTLAVSLLKKGFKVDIYERDVTAIRGEGKYRGPIQMQSNALATFEAIDEDMAREIFNEGVITGDRVNGLCSGATGEWYVKFDTFQPAFKRGIPVTRVINRVTLQQILLKYVQKYGGEDVIHNGMQAVDYQEVIDEQGKEKVKLTLSLNNGQQQQVEGDILIGADGIWSKIRKQLIGQKPPNYSNYTCYSGVADFFPFDIDQVGYRIFLGHERYFVMSDVGFGKIQWYGFHRQDAGGTSQTESVKKELFDIFSGWSDLPIDLIRATPADDVIRRDVYDRPPTVPWNKGRVVVLGDAAHPMQPNLGQGGGMAIEDCFAFSQEIEKEFSKADASTINIKAMLGNFFRARIVRSSIVSGMAGAAAYMASTYEEYIGEILGPIGLQWITKYKIPHPGKVLGRFILQFTMPQVLEWVLCGNIGTLDKVLKVQKVQQDDSRVRRSKLEKYPDIDLPTFNRLLREDDYIIRRANAEWLMVPLDTEHMYQDDYDIFKGQKIVDSPQTIANGLVTCWKEDSDYFIKVNAQNNDGAEIKLNDTLISPNITTRILPYNLLSITNKSGSNETYKVTLKHQNYYKPQPQLA